MTTRRVLAAGAILALVSLVIVLLRNERAVQPADNSAPHAHTPIQRKPAAADLGQAERAVPPSGESPITDSANSSPEAREGLPALVPPALSELSTTESPDLANRLGAPNTEPEAEAAIVLDLLKLYRRLFGAYPAGENNSQFVNALRGANRTKVPLLPHDHPRLSPAGELLDAWGTPFFFHQNSRNSIEVRSAGPDRRLYTDDDIFAGRPAPAPDTANSGEPLAE